VNAVTRLPNATSEELEAFVRKHDIQFFTEGRTLKYGVKTLATECGRRVSSARLRTYADTHCRYWKQMPRREYSTAGALRECDWSRIRRWIDSHLELVEKSETVEFIALLMRVERIKVNPDLLRNSLSFMSVWKGAK
jgi:hypothetical protein